MTKTISNSTLEKLLVDFSADPKSAQPPIIQKTLFLARRLQERATELQTSAEKKQQSELDRMLQTPSDKATLAQMTDPPLTTVRQPFEDMGRTAFEVLTKRMNNGKAAVEPRILPVTVVERASTAHVR